MEDSQNKGLKFKETQASDFAEGSLGVIKPKKRLDDLTQSIVSLLVDYHNAYYKKYNLKPIQDLKADAEIIKTNLEYHPPLICILMILRMVNGAKGFEFANLLRNTYSAFVESGCDPYTAVSNVLAMFGVIFDESGVPSLEVRDIAEIEMPDGIEF